MNNSEKSYLDIKFLYDKVIAKKEKIIFIDDLEKVKEEIKEFFTIFKYNNLVEYNYILDNGYPTKKEFNETFFLDVFDDIEKLNFKNREQEIFFLFQTMFVLITTLFEVIECSKKNKLINEENNHIIKKIEQEQGWFSLPNSALIKAIEGCFYILIFQDNNNWELYLSNAYHKDTKLKINTLISSGIINEDMINKIQRVTKNEENQIIANNIEMSKKIKGSSK